MAGDKLMCRMTERLCDDGTIEYTIICFGPHEPGPNDKIYTMADIKRLEERVKWIEGEMKMSEVKPHELFEGEKILDDNDNNSPPIWVLAQIAEATHQANRSYCVIIGDNSQPAWADAPNWQKISAVKGVLGVFDGNTPEQSHESWLAEKKATGWKYGEVKDPEKKEHPCFVPYSELPEAQKIKDHVFVTTAKALLKAYNDQKQ